MNSLMKRTPAKHRIRAGISGGTIRCSTQDVASQLPIAVALVFKHTLDCERLASSLATVLRDYPVFAGSFRHEAGRLMLDCDDRGVDFEVYQCKESIAVALRNWSERRSQFVPGERAVCDGATLLQIPR